MPHVELLFKIMYVLTQNVFPVDISIKQFLILKKSFFKVKYLNKDISFVKKINALFDSNSL